MRRCDEEFSFKIKALTVGGSISASRRLQLTPDKPHISTLFLLLSSVQAGLSNPAPTI